MLHTCILKYVSKKKKYCNTYFIYSVQWNMFLFNLNVVYFNVAYMNIQIRIMNIQIRIHLHSNTHMYIEIGILNIWNTYFKKKVRIEIRIFFLMLCILMLHTCILKYAYINIQAHNIRIHTHIHINIFVLIYRCPASNSSKSSLCTKLKLQMHNKRSWLSRQTLTEWAKLLLTTRQLLTE